jgi:hypothetical protein
MLTKPSSLALAQQWVILLLHAVPTSLPVFGIAMVLVVGVLLGGFQLYVLNLMTSFAYFITVC